MYLLSYVAKENRDGPHQWMWFRSLDEVNAAARMFSDAGFITSLQYYAETNERDVFHVANLSDVRKFILNLDYLKYEENGSPQF